MPWFSGPAGAGSLLRGTGGARKASLPPGFYLRPLRVQEGLVGGGKLLLIRGD